MRLTTIILFAAFMQVSAAGLAQNVTLSKHNEALKNVLKELRRQSGYDFVYSESLLEKAIPVNIDVKEMPIEDALKRIFGDQPINYNVQDKTVVLTLKAATIQIKSTAATDDIEVHGKVMDDKGVALSGVTVTVKGTGRKTSTNAAGEFSIPVQANSDILVFTHIGMEPIEVRVGENKDLTVTLKSTTTLLNEVKVNTGFQSIKKEQMTGATVTVSSSELEQRYQPNVLNNLEGRVPGLVTYNGKTEIRGVSTLQASTAVLIVVDGLPIEGSIADINPYDIESVTTLKDAAAAAIYGARASNGVIVIVTKKAKEKRTVVEFATDVSVTAKPNIDFHLVSPSQQVDLESSYWNYDYLSGKVAGAVDNTTNQINLGSAITPVQYAWYQYAQGNISQTQLQSQLNAFKKNNFRQQYKDNAMLDDVLQQYNFAIRTNTDRLNSSIVVNYKNDNTGIINGYNKQLNLFYKGTYTVNKWLDINYGINTVIGMTNASNSDFAGSPYNEPDYQQLVAPNGSHVLYTTNDYNQYNTLTENNPNLQSLLVNHLDELNLDRIKGRSTNSRYYVNMNVKLLPGLTFNPYFQYENQQSTTSAYSEQNSYAYRLLTDLYSSRTGTDPNYSYSDLLPTTGGMLATTQRTGDYWTARGQLNYNHDFGKNSLSVIAGTEFRQQHSSGTDGLLLGYDQQLQSQSTATVDFNALSQQTIPSLVAPGYQLSSVYQNLANKIGVIRDTTNRYASFYANASNTYDHKYTIFGSLRKDYANLFGLDAKFRGRPLWSAGAGWNVHNEEFMSDVHWVNFLKLRASYGVTGNINPFANSYLTATTGTTNPLTGLPIATIANPANPYLTWERTATLNIGTDFTLIAGRLSGSLDWYRKKGTDLFANKLLDPSEGFSNYTVNNASMLNNGLELSLNYKWFNPQVRNAFGWSTLVIVSHNNNKITSVDQLATSPLAKVEGSNAGQENPSIPSSYTAGYPVNSLFSFQYKGLNAEGQPQWLKADGTLTTLALSASDMSAVAYSGQLDPKNNIAVTNIFQYKGFNLNILMVYYGGQSLRADAPDVYEAPEFGAMPSYLLNSWTPTNTHTNIPGYGQYVPPAAVPSYYLGYSDAFVRAGDFIKIRNAVLGYNLPQATARKIGASSVNVHFQLNNPKALWLKNNDGIDPETGGAPLPTSYVFGLSVRY